MAWKTGFFDKVSDFLRFVAYGCIAVNAIILAVFTVWFTAKFVWHLIDWLNRVMFANKW